MNNPTHGWGGPAVWSLAALLVCAANSQAATTTYADQATFNAGLLSAGLTSSSYGFPAPDLVGDPASVTAGPATLAGMNTGAVAGFSKDSYGIAGAFYTHQLVSQNESNNVVSVSFAAPVRGFAFVSNVMNPPLGDAINPNNWPVSGMALLTLTSSSGDVVSFSSPLFSNYGSDPTVNVPFGFSGIISDVAITSVTLSVSQGQNLQLTEFSISAVPEPQGIALMLAGLGLVGLIAWRRLA